MKQPAVEWLWKALLDSGFKDIEDVEGFYYKAKEMEAKQRQADTNHGYAQGYDDAAQGKEPMQPEML